MRASVPVLGFILGLVGALVAATAGAASITVSPTTAPVGGTVTVSGDVLGPNGQAGCQLPGTVLLFSAGFGDLNTPVQASAGADAKYSVQVTIPSSVAPGTYTITARCGGGNLGVQATLAVTAGSLPATGSGGLLEGTATDDPLNRCTVGLGLALAATALLAVTWRGRRHLR